MNARDFIMSQELTTQDNSHFAELCKSWYHFSQAVGQFDKTDTAKLLKYLIINKPYSKTFGNRAVSRLNTLNKINWKDLLNGNRENDREKIET